MSPHHETQGDIDRETAVAQACASHWRATAAKLPGNARLDWFFHRGPEMVAFVEIKIRSNRMLHDFPTVLLDYAKHEALYHASAAFSVPAFYIVSFKDVVVGVETRDLVGLPVEARGRNDRGDPLDLKPGIVIPNYFFVKAAELFK